MPIQLINTGAASNDGTGDTLRQGAIKVNQNFTEIYNTLGDGTGLTPFTGLDTARYSDIAGIATNAVYFDNQLPSYYRNYLNLTNTPTALSQFTNDTGFLTKTVDANGITVVGGIVTATSFRGDGSQLTGISTSVDVGVLQAQINSLGTNLNIVGFYDAVAGVVTGLTIVGQGRPGLGIGLTLPSVGINTGDYFIVSKGGADVGIATYTNPGISSVYSGDWIVGIDDNSWSILSYSQQVVAPRANRADIADSLDGNASLNLSGVVTATQFFGNGGALTNLTGANPGTYGDDSTVPQIVVDGNGKISSITNVSIALTNIVAGLGTGYWSKNTTGINTTSSVGIGTTNATEALTVYGNITISPTSVGSILLDNNIKVKYGFNQEVNQYYNGSEFITQSANPISFRDNSNNPVARFVPGGSAELYDGVTKKFETTGLGVTVFGSYLGDGSRLTGVITSLQAGANTLVEVTGGIATISSSGSGDGAWTSGVLGIGTTASVGIGTTLAPGELKLQVKGQASIIGVLKASWLEVTGISTLTGGHIQIPGSTNIKIGNNSLGSGSQRNIGIGDNALASVQSGSPGHNLGYGEYSLYQVTSGGYNIGLGDRAGQNITTGDYNVVIGSFLGNNYDLDIRTSDYNIVLSDGSGIVRQYFDSTGKCGINTTVLHEALNVAGIVSATGFHGTLDAANLYGQLPAIDGSLLTNVVATGSGVEIRENNTVLGVAATVNFGENIIASVAGGIASITGAPNYWSNGGVGINTTANVHLYSNLTVEGTSEFGDRISVASTINFLSDKSRVAYEASTKTFEITNFEGTDSPGDIGSILFKTTDPGIPALQKEALRIYSAGGNPDRLVRIYRNLQVDGESTLGQRAYVGTAVTLSEGGAEVTGVVTATSFAGSASGLTGLPAGQLTGTLPAIDGSNLLNVNASGEGVVVEDDGINAGTAKTLDFGTGIDVDYDATSGIATVSASGGSLRQRLVKVGVTTVISNTAIGNTDIIGFKAYSLMKVGLSTSAWLRLYTDSASRTADASRSVGEDPLPGSGVIAEVVTTGLSTSQIMSPFVLGGNLNEPPDTTIYASIQNLSGSTQSVTAYLTILQLEA